jgi:hypothetical protein
MEVYTLIFFQRGNSGILLLNLMYRFMNAFQQKLGYDLSFITEPTVCFKYKPILLVR